MFLTEAATYNWLRWNKTALQLSYKTAAVMKHPPFSRQRELPQAFTKALTLGRPKLHQTSDLIQSLMWNLDYKKNTFEEVLQLI